MRDELRQAGREIYDALQEETALMNAAADSYRRHFGDRAVEAAEQDVLGTVLQRLREFLDAYDNGSVELNSEEIGGGGDIPPHPWHEYWLHYIRAVLSLVREGEKG